jgi:hypothetical protein
LKLKSFAVHHVRLCRSNTIAGSSEEER